MEFYSHTLCGIKWAGRMTPGASRVYQSYGTFVGMASAGNTSTSPPFLFSVMSYLSNLFIEENLEEIPEREVWVLDIATRETVVFVAPTLYAVFERVVQYHCRPCVLYWQWQQLNPYASFEDYGMGYHIELLCDVLSPLPIEEPGRYPSSGDEATSDEEHGLELQGASYLVSEVQSGSIPLALGDLHHNRRWYSTRVPKYNAGYAQYLRHVKNVFDNVDREFDEFMSIFARLGINDRAIKTVENVLITLYLLHGAKSNVERGVAAANFLKLQSERSLVDLSSQLAAEIAKACLDLQSDQLLESVTDFRSVISNWDDVRKSVLGKKCARFAHLLVKYGVLAQLGLQAPQKDDTPMTILDSADLVHGVVDALSYMIQRGLMYRKTRNWEVFVHGPASYMKWIDKSCELRRQGLAISNLEIMGTDYHKFVADLKEAIENGKAITRFAVKEEMQEMRIVRSTLNDLLLLEANVLTRKAAQQERQAPFGILIFGGSCVAKSMFSKLIFTYFGLKIGLPISDEFRFVRNPADPYWSNFNSQQWCIQLDDIGYLYAGKAQLDNSLNEMIQIGNNVPLCPPQAALEDKGKTPVRAKLVTATSNVKGLNAASYFQCPLAVQRRLPWVVTVEPKPEYCQEGEASKMIDPSKIPALDGDWPNLWLIKVERVVPAGPAGDREMAKHQEVASFSDINEFLDWFGDVITAFHDIQTRAMVADNAMSTFVLCMTCNRVKGKCKCTELQSNPIELGEFEIGPLMDRVLAQVHVEETWSAWMARKFESLFGFIFSIAFALYEKYAIVRICADYMLSFQLCRKFIRLYLLDAVATKVGKRNAMRLAGWLAYDVYASVEWRAILLGVGSLVAVYKVISSVFGSFSSGAVLQGSESEPAEVTRKMQEFPEPVEKDTFRVVSSDHFEKSEKENVWKRDDYELTSFDIDPMNANYETMPRNVLLDTIRRNTARIYFYSRSERGNRVSPANAFCVGGHRWVTNNHVVPTAGTLRVELKFEREVQGTSLNVSFSLEQSSIFRDIEGDLAWFQVFAVDARKDLTRLIAKDSLSGIFNAHYVGKDPEFKPWNPPVRAVKLVNVRVPSMDRSFKVWGGTLPANMETIKGDCGTVLLGVEPTVVILGIHQQGGGSNYVASVRLSQSQVEAAGKFFEWPVIQSGVPQISLEDRARQVGPLHHKSAVRWLTDGTLSVFGSFLGWKPSPRSKVNSTILGDEILKRRGWQLSMGRPRLNDWRPWHFAYNDIVNQTHTTKVSILEKCVDGYVNDILRSLPPSALRNLRIIDEFAAVNGIQGVRFLDKLNFNSSMGEPWCHTKKFHISACATKELPEAKEFDAETRRRVLNILERYKRGIRACPVFSGQVKDEVRDKKKIEQGKIRIFTGAPVDWSIAVRMLLLSFVKVFQEHPFIFEGFPGCVAQSLEWERIREYLTQFSTERMIAGDYGKFDKKMLALFIINAFIAIRRVLKAAGWSETELLMVACVAEDIAYAVVNFNGDLVAFFGSNPSGHPLTVILNCIVNSLYMRYCYFVLNPDGECSSFKENVALATYGDDNAMGVSEKVPWFNHTALVSVLAQIGVEYTMADKGAESVPYIDISNVSFLKRTWRWDSEIGAFVCPLEEQSIHKMLCLGVAGKSLSPEMRMVTVMVGAVNEWFWYGKERFESERKFLRDLISEFHLEPEYELVPFPTWSELVRRFWRASKGVELKREGAVEPSWLSTVPTSTPDDDLSLGDLRLSARGSVQIQGCLRSHAFPYLGLRPQGGQNKTELEGGQSGPPSEINSLANTVNSEGRTGTYQSGNEVARASTTSIECSSDCIKCTLQSNDLPVESKSDMFAEQTTGFMDEAVGDIVGYVPDTDALAEGDGITDAGLAEFLRRPVRVANFTWLESDPVGIKTTISPWNAFFNDASIKYKLNNYGFIRCNLKLKFIVNASPFYYGLMRACYQPLPSFTPNTIVVDSGTKHFIPYSQQPHVNILPQDSEGAVMTLPFFWQRNWLRVGRAADFSEMATLRFIIWAALQSANGVTGQGCTVQVYAWAEDVVLSGPTLALSMQGDEYGVGPVSGPASTVARIAGMVKGVPIIGKFATATEMGANAISGIAKLFGFTNVPVIEPSQPYRMNPFPPMASAEIGYPVEKLTLDPKNELSIDPSAIGLRGHDELAIEHLVTRESYLCTATWTTTTAVDTLIFGARVTPFMFDNDGATVNKMYFTPMGMVANLFQNWRGDIIFTFHFITSPYHKGRVRISYDPYSTSVMTAGDVGSSIYNTIVDIGEQNKVEVRVPYQQALAWLQVDSSFGTSNVPYILSGSSLSLDDVTTNGIICMKALTLLTAPVGTSSVSVIISVRGAENMEFANPIAPGASFSPFSVQSEDHPLNPEEGGKDVMDFKASPEMHLDRYRVNFGECVKSLRPLLRRSNFVETFTGTSTTDQDVIMYERHSRYPLYYGYDPNGLHTAKGLVATATTFPFNWVLNTPYHWIAPCFVAQKGSVFWHYNAEADVTPTVMYATRINHIGQNTVAIGQTSRSTAANSATAGFYAVNTTSTAGGLALTNTRTESGLSVGVPNYTQFKFQSTAPGNTSDPPNAGTAGYDGTTFEMVQVTIHADGTNGPKPQNIKVHKYFGVGTDFNLYFFLNCPTYYRLSSTPVIV